MRAKARIRIKGEDANIIVGSLKPDNMKNNSGSDTDTVIEERSESIAYFEADKIGSLIASVDDYLMNARVAMDMTDIKRKERKNGV